MQKIPIIPKREVIEGSISKKAEKMPVFNLATGNPQNICPSNTTAYDIPFETSPSKRHYDHILRL